VSRVAANGANVGLQVDAVREIARRERLRRRADLIGVLGC
jgi:hypothetical protein